MKLAPCVHKFFAHYLPNLKGSSDRTITAYRDVFTSFLPFAAQYHHIQVQSLRVDHLTQSLVLDFLDYLQSTRNNAITTRNHRLAAIKSLAKMIRLLYPEKRQLAETILSIPLKRGPKPLVGFLYAEEVLDVFNAVDLRRKEGFRDYALLHLLYDSAARASEIATLELDYFDPRQKTLMIKGKGNQPRLIQLEPKTVEIVQLYIRKYRVAPKPLFQQRLFISQRGEQLTRHGINRICKKYLNKVLTPKRLKAINPVHSFRHSRAVDMLYQGYHHAEIANHLGHKNVNSTSVYLHLDLSRKRKIQKRLVDYMKASSALDTRIRDLLDWENEKDILTWLDSL